MNSRIALCAALLLCAHCEGPGYREVDAGDAAYTVDSMQLVIERDAGADTVAAADAGSADSSDGNASIQDARPACIPQPIGCDGIDHSCQNLSNTSPEYQAAATKYCQDTIPQFLRVAGYSAYCSNKASRVGSTKAPGYACVEFIEAGRSSNWCWRTATDAQQCCKLFGFPCQ